MAQNGGPTLSDGTDERVGEAPQPHAMSDGNGANVREAMRTLSDDNGESFGKDGRYHLRERRPRGEWWKNHILPHHEQVRANVALVDDPLNLCEAMRSEDASKWETAMQEEYDSLVANGTWELSTLPEGRRIVGCKWVFYFKHDVSDNIIRYKARLVAKSYSQVAGVDFDETFASVAKFIMIWCILAIVAAMDWQIHQMDMKTAFLNGVLEVVIYMDQPKGFVQKDKEHLMCKLIKALYGLKQSPRAWYQRIDLFFINEGFSSINTDHSLYIKQTDNYILVAILYVDDLIILSSDVTELKWLKSQLEKKFEMSDLGELNYCLGVQFQRDRKTDTITMSQTSYIEEVLRRFNMEDCKPVTTPSDANSKLLRLSDEEFGNVKMEMEGVPYKAAVGSLMYAMVGTRPDLAFAVSTVSQFMAKAGPSHWMAVKRILRYLKRSLELKLSLGGNNICLVGFCDADWAGDTNDRRSTMGYIFLVGRGAISQETIHHCIVHNGGGIHGY